MNDRACRRTLDQIKQEARLFRLAPTCVQQVEDQHFRVVVLGASVISKKEILDKEVFNCLLVHSLDRSVDRYNLLFAYLFLVFRKHHSFYHVNALHVFDSQFLFLCDEFNEYSAEILLL